MAIQFLEADPTGIERDIGTDPQKPLNEFPAHASRKSWLLQTLGRLREMLPRQRTAIRPSVWEVVYFEVQPTAEKMCPSASPAPSESPSPS